MFLGALCDDFGHIMLNECTFFTLCETWHIYNCESFVGLKEIYYELLIMIIIDQMQNFFPVTFLTPFLMTGYRLCSSIRQNALKNWRISQCGWRGLPASWPIRKLGLSQMM